ncbi:MAG: ABC transporter permease [Vicinamibacterales bacterium]
MRWDGLRFDLLSGLRGFRRTPGVTLAALATLVLGIGAASAMFTVVRSVLFAPLPYAEPDRRVLIWSRWVSFDKTWLSDQEILDYRRLSTTMTAIAGWTTEQQNLTGDGPPVRVGVGLVTANVFDVLGARPLLGRPIAPAEDRPGAAPVAVLGYGLWQARFGGDPSVVGRRILLDDVPVEIVGVMPDGFRLPTDFTEDAAEPTRLWRPLAIDEADASRGSHGYYAAAVLAPGATAASASDELAALTRAMTEQGLYPEAMRFTAFAVPVETEIRGGLRPAMWLLTGAVVCLLLIACANVANLLLVRGEARAREMAVRTAIGATGARLIGQLLGESTLLAAAGGLGGLGLAAAALQGLVAVDPTLLPPLAPIRLDGTVVAATLGLAVVTTLVFGLVPALRTPRVSLVEALREGQHATASPTRQRLRAALVVVEVTLAVVLVVGAGLMGRSLAALGRVPLGFDPSHVLTFRVALPAARYDTPERVVAFYRELVTRLRALPGVTAAGLVRVLPLATSIGDRGVDVEGFEESPGRNAKGDWQIASDGAFEAMGMRLVRGRWFTPGDTTGSTPIVVVNETMARAYWPEGQAVGGRVRIGGADSGRPWAQVVGIVADERHNGVTAAVKEKFYVPHSQWHVVTGGNLVRNAFLVVRSAGAPEAVAGPAAAAVVGLDPTLPVAAVRPMTEVVGAALATPRLTGVLLGSFAAAALALAIVGLYGVVSYLVARRTHEIGIRVALGAERASVLRLVMARGVGLALGGVALGIVAALAAARLMRSLLYEVTPSDPVTFLVVPAALLLVAVIASLVPALRALRIDPLRALRVE